MAITKNVERGHFQGTRYGWHSANTHEITEVAWYTEYDDTEQEVKVKVGYVVKVQPNTDAIPAGMQTWDARVENARTTAIDIIDALDGNFPGTVNPDAGERWDLFIMSHTQRNSNNAIIRNLKDDAPGPVTDEELISRFDDALGADYEAVYTLAAYNGTFANAEQRLQENR